MGSKSGGIGADDEMRLYVWGSGWNLPSIDPGSLQIMAYIKFCGAPVTILPCENPWKSPKGILPFFQHGTRILYSPSEILSYLRQKNYSCDFGLSVNESGQVIAYTNLVLETLDSALQYYCWVESSNYASVMRPCIVKRTPWAYKWWYADRKRRSALELIDAQYTRPYPEHESAEPELLSKARDCIAVLSDKLSTQEYFMYSNSPSALDAIIFAYLAAFLKIPLPYSPVKELIRATPNLERFVARILSRYYSGGRATGDFIISSTSNFGPDGHPTTTNPAEEQTYPLYQKIAAVGVGLAIMLGFAYYSGLVTFGAPDSSSIDEDETTDDDDEGLIWE